MADYFSRDTIVLTNKKLFLLDMDGTLYNGMELFPQTRNFLQTIRENGAQYRFITNNSSKSVQAYQEKLKSMGIDTQLSDFYTSAQVTVHYLLEHHAGELVFCMGTASLLAELAAAGISVTTECDEAVSVVLMGYDTELTYEKLRRICYLLKDETRTYLATNCDLVCPIEFGYVPDCGSFSIMIKNATGREPRFLGKPEPTMIEYCMQEAGVSRADTVVIGDRLYTDIASAVAAGVTAVCVLSGEASLEDIEASSIKADFVLQSIGDYWSKSD